MLRENGKGSQMRWAFASEMNDAPPVDVVVITEAERCYSRWVG